MIRGKLAIACFHRACVCHVFHAHRPRQCRPSHIGAPILLPSTPMKRTPYNRVPSPTNSAYSSGISNYRTESYRPLRDNVPVPQSPSDPRAVARTHFEELSRYLASYLAKGERSSSNILWVYTKLCSYDRLQNLQTLVLLLGRNSLVLLDSNSRNFQLMYMMSLSVARITHQTTKVLFPAHSPSSHRLWPWSFFVYSPFPTRTWRLSSETESSSSKACNSSYRSFQGSFQWCLLRISTSIPRIQRWGMSLAWCCLLWHDPFLQYHVFSL